MHTFSSYSAGTSKKILKNCCYLISSVYKSLKKIDSIAQQLTTINLFGISKKTFNIGRFGGRENIKKYIYKDDNKIKKMCIIRKSKWKFQSTNS